jgi:hypothetical protein
MAHPVITIIKKMSKTDINRQANLFRTISLLYFAFHTKPPFVLNYVRFDRCN